MKHRVTGYDKRTEFLAQQHDIPADLMPFIRTISRVPMSDSQTVGGYLLNEAAVRRLSLKLGRELNADSYDWFIEPVASDAR